MFAAVDLGSNSFRLHIGSHDGDKIRVIKSARDPIRLAAGLDSKGYLTDQAMKVAIDSLTRFKALLSTYPLDAVRVVATNTLRIARNANILLPAAEKALGYPIEVISGEEEARLIYMGVAGTLAAQNERRLVLDIGGGSTELILGNGDEIERAESFGIGTARQSLSFFPEGRITASAYEAAIISARSYFEDAAPSYHPKYWTRAYGSSGTIRAIADVVEKNGFGDGTLSAKSLDTLKTRFIQYGDIDSIAVSGMKPERTAVIVGGLAVLIGAMQELEIKAMTPIDAGLRMGVLWDLQLRATKRDRREQSVRAFLQRFHADESRADRTADIAGNLYRQLKPDSNIHEKPLYWSALLHETGLAVSHTGYHKHGAYLIQHADLPGFTAREQQIMGMLVLGQKGNLRKVRDMLSDVDFAKAVLALRLAVMLMHARIDADFGQLRIRMKGRIELEMNRDWVSLHPTLGFWMEKEREYWSDAGIDFTIRFIG